MSPDSIVTSPISHLLTSQSAAATVPDAITAPSVGTDVVMKSRKASRAQNT